MPSSHEGYGDTLAKPTIKMKTPSQKKVLGAWIKAPRKEGQPQMSCRNNVVTALTKVLPTKMQDMDEKNIVKV